MRKLIKWSGIVFGATLGLVIFLLLGAAFIGSNRLTKTSNVQPQTIDIDRSPAALERGGYLFHASCAGCHGDNLAGTEFIEDPVLGSVPAPNLTAGAGGIGQTYTDVDFVRAIRHGVRPDGTPLMIMPSGAYYFYSDTDLGALIAFIQNFPALDQSWPAKNVAPMGRILLATGQLGNVLQAETIDHDGPRPPVPLQDITVEYGEYLVNTGDCRNCHGANLTGQQPGEPGAPFAPGLTPGGHLVDWSTETFIDAMRTGRTPEGHALDGRFMPWQYIGRLTDEDLTAMFLYLQSLPTGATTSR